MAEILEVTDPNSITKLGERIEAALQEFKANQDLASPTPKELRKTFKRLSKSHRDLYEDMKRFGPREQKILEVAASDFPSVRLARDGRFGMVEAMAALERIGALLRGAQRWLPKVERGPQRDSARWFLVHSLGIIYATTRSHIGDDGAEVFDLPSRRHNAYKGEDYGRFRDFVVAVHEAFSFDDPERGTDDVIRSVWSGMGKKR